MAKSIKVFVNIKKIKKGEKMIISSVFALYTHTQEREITITQKFSGKHARLSWDHSSDKNSQKKGYENDNLLLIFISSTLIDN